MAGHIVKRSSATTMEPNTQQVEGIHIEQGVLARMPSIGTLITSATGTAHAPLIGIADPMAFRRAFVKARDAGPAQASVAPARLN